jgi:heme-degrading monooxygenase HmoA
MFVVIEFPKMDFNKEQDFEDWFKASNQKFQKFNGIVSRNLLKQKHETDGSKYIAIMELENEQAYVNLQSSDIHKNTLLGLIAIIDDIPIKTIYETVYSINTKSLITND